MDVNDYLGLITSEHADQPDFTAMIAAVCSFPVQVGNTIESLDTAFDIDSAQGVQLDVIGQWVGISRNIAVPITGVYFSWDGTNYTVGWDFGSWQPTNQPNAIVSLPDDAYLTLLKGKIAANNWDGTTEGAYAIWGTLFPNLTILIQDYQNMSYAVGLVGEIVDSVTLEILVNGYIPLKPQGVQIVEYFVPVNTGPLFGWDLETSYISGYNVGSWAREVAGS